MSGSGLGDARVLLRFSRRHANGLGILSAEAAPVSSHRSSFVTTPNYLSIKFYKSKSTALVL
jgi:hypothetical protein